MVIPGWSINELLALSFILNVFAAFCVLFVLRSASKERQQMNKEMFGILRKIEGLTSHRREQMLKQYDKILDTLSTRLPPTLAAEAGKLIFEMESRILSRLAELEPNLKHDKDAKRKLNELICQMEQLEKTVVNLTSDTVHSVLAERRSELFREPFDDPDEYLISA